MEAKEAKRPREEEDAEPLEASVQKATGAWQVPAGSDGSDGYALFSTTDGHVVELNLSELKDLDVHLSHVVEHQPSIPMADGSDRRYWRSNMRRALLLSLAATVRHRQLHLIDGCTFEEAISEFDRQGLRVTERHASKRAGGLAPVLPPARTLGNHIHLLAKEVVNQVSECVANSLATWPRLISTCEAALTGQVHEPISASGTEVYVKFADKPLPYASTHPHASRGGRSRGVDASARQRELETLARLWPGWLQRTLVAFTHAAMLAESGRAGGSSSSSSNNSFNVLQSDTFVQTALHCARNSQFGDYWATQFDLSSFDPSMSRSTAQRVERCVQEMKCALTSPAVCEDRDMWAKVVLEVICELQSSAKSPAVIFGGQLGNDGGNDAARTMLENALRRRNIRVVRWVDRLPDGVRPAIFPPNWEGSTSDMDRSSNSVGSMACACAVKLAWMLPPDPPDPSDAAEACTAGQ